MAGGCCSLFVISGFFADYAFVEGKRRKVFPLWRNYMKRVLCKKVLQDFSAVLDLSGYTGVDNYSNMVANLLISGLLEEYRDGRWLFLEYTYNYKGDA